MRHMCYVLLEDKHIANCVYSHGLWRSVRVFFFEKSMLLIKNHVSDNVVEYFVHLHILSCNVYKYSLSLTNHQTPSSVVLTTRIHQSIFSLQWKIYLVKFFPRTHSLCLLSQGSTVPHCIDR